MGRIVLQPVQNENGGDGTVIELAGLSGTGS